MGPDPGGEPDVAGLPTGGWQLSQGRTGLKFPCGQGSGGGSTGNVASKRHSTQADRPVARCGHGDGARGVGERLPRALGLGGRDAAESDITGEGYAYVKNTEH